MSGTWGTGGGGPWRALFVSGERLGWVFSDRNRFLRPFEEPEPPEGDASQDRTSYEVNARAKLLARLLRIRHVVLLGSVAGLPWMVWRTVHSVSSLKLPVLFLSAVIFGVAAGLVWCLSVVAHLAAVRSYGSWRRKRHRDLLRVRRAQWSQRRAVFEVAERRRVALLEEWQQVAVAPGWARIDVVGGSSWGWEAFVTVFGSSALTDRGAVTVLDLSGEMVVREFARGAEAAGTSVDVQILPMDMAVSDLIVGLNAGVLANLFVESLYGGLQDADRGERMMDTRLLTAVCEALEPGGLSMPRIAAGLRVLLGEPAREGELGDAERRLVMDELFSEDYRMRSSESLRRIEAFAHQLGELGSRSSARPHAELRCVVMSTEWRSSGGEFLADLIVAWAARQVLGGMVATLVVAGADDLAVRHVERLSDMCERRGVRLVVMFRHLREPVARLLGAGPVGFMRLGNHEEAARAADFIGREHRFEVSQLAHTFGGNETHSFGISDGASLGESVTTGKGSSEGGGGPGFLGSGSRTWSTSDSYTWNISRNWGRSVNEAAGTSWSDTSTRQRVFEHTVEPRTLQQLPDYAMVLVDHSDGHTRVGPVEINPEIALLRRNPAESVPPPESFRPPQEHAVVPGPRRPEIERTSGGWGADSLRNAGKALTQAASRAGLRRSGPRRLP
ncbi:hypothetical protein [Streptantibioticus silvisoli]|uniref:TraD/TraG TraM recognition site domain-containing protein n=1 Tax=Streptantibioticus silvisoli TaxID=2705255 RepID=A0ABT6VZN5_9ACTN|nr:hypothetical protein [Streptantibioticus silvisoli]MDI5963953.1 hypothetical protein [Streptantibioticus silvisoli]